MKIIDSFRIKYFRSIVSTARGGNAHQDTNHLNIIIGENDVGKSNILRALDLFFNHNRTERSYSFWNDFSHQRVGRQREETRFEIELIINPPRNQNLTHHGKIVWTKTWRPNSSQPQEDIRYKNHHRFDKDGRVHIYKWLKSLRYRYVPAIKSDEYFSQLILDLYEVMENEARSLQEAFTNLLKDKSEFVSKELQKRIGIDSQLTYSGNIKDLFSAIQFYSNQGTIPLSSRGDGIKVRHIPVILQTIAQAEIGRKKRGNPITNTIWGIEEPENNLEFVSAKRMADSFLEYVDGVYSHSDAKKKYDEGVQIFISTHSPVFYSMVNRMDSRINSFYVSKREDESSIIKKLNPNDAQQLEEDMSLIPLIKLSSYWRELENERKQLHIEAEELKQIKNSLNLHKKIVVLTEDQKPSYLITLLEANGLTQDDYDLVSANGCSKIDSAKVLKDYIDQQFEKLSPILLVHRDRDYLKQDKVEQEKADFENKGILLYITIGTDIEAEFVNAEHIKYCYPSIDADVVITEALAESREMSKQKLLKSALKHNYNRSDSVLVDCIDEIYSSDERKFFHGKTTMGHLKSIIQKRLGQNVDLNRESPHLVNRDLKGLIEKLKSGVK